MSRSARAAAILLGGTALAGVGATTLPSGEPVVTQRLTPTAIRASRIDLGNGILMHAVERGSSSGTPVILLHGLSDSWASFSRLYEYLPLDLRLISVDLRGHGESSKPAGDYSMKVLAHDVITLMDSLGIANAFVVGHSMGTLVAQQVAMQQPNRVRGLALIGGGRSGQQFNGLDEFQKSLLQFPDLESAVPEAVARDFQVSTLHRPIPPAFMDSAVAASRQLPMRVWHALLDDMLKTPEAPATQPVRTLVLWGDKDQFLGGAEQLRLALKWKARYVPFPETGHAVHWERPAEVARVLMEFLRDSR